MKDLAEFQELLKLARSTDELRDMIEVLMTHREQLKRVTLAALEKRTNALLEEIEHLKREELITELECFKETLAIQRRLFQ